MRILVGFLVLSWGFGFQATAEAGERTVRSSQRATSSGPGARAAIPLSRRFGGTVVVTRDYEVEVMPRAYGKIKAWVYDRSGAAAEPTNMHVAVRVMGSDRRSHVVDVRWDPSKRLFIGFLPNGVYPTTGPMGVTVSNSGRAQRGTVPVAAVVPHPRYGGLVIAAGEHAYEVLPFRNGRVEAVFYGAHERGDQGRLNVTAAVRGHDGSPHAVRLGWDASRARFVGHAPLGVQLGVGPVDLLVTEGRATYRGGIGTSAALPAASSGGRWIIAGSYLVHLAPRAGRALQARVYDRHGKPAAYGHTQLNMNVHDHGNGIYPVPMIWDVRRGVYDGRTPPLADEQLVWVDVKVKVSDTVKSAFAPEASSVGSAELDWSSATGPAVARRSPVLKPTPENDVAAATDTMDLAQSQPAQWQTFRPAETPPRNDSINKSLATGIY